MSDPNIPPSPALPTLRQIQFLLALEEHRSFRKAAEACFVTQSTLSAGIQEMENILGLPVIDRSNRRKMRLTRLGEELASEGKHAIAQLTHITERARRQQHLLEWPLRVGVIPTIAPYLLPKILAPVQKAFPKMQMHIHEVQSPDLVAQVTDGQLDFGIMAFPYDVQPLEQLILFEEAFYCASSDRVFDGKQSVTVQDIELHKVLLLSDGHCLRDHALLACRMKAHQAPQDISATSLSTLIQLVAQNYGITLLPEMVAHSDTLPANLRVLPITPHTPMRRIGVVWRKNSILQQDIFALAIAIYRILHGASIFDDTCNIPPQDSFKN